MLPSWHSYRTHCEVLGRSQLGKTSFAIYCLMLHILGRNRVIVLDYKSGLYKSAMAYIARFRPRTPAVFLNLSNPDRLIPFNPFTLPKGRDLSAHVSHVSKVILKLVSDQSPQQVQNYAYAAEAFFAYVASSGEPLNHAMRLFENPKYWVVASEKVPEAFAHMMRRLGATAPKDWDYKVGVLERRLRPFATSSILRKVSSLPNPIFLSELYRSGVSLFVNATPSGSLSVEAARIFLGLILSDVSQMGLEFATDPKTGFLYADEAEEYATDIGSLLDLVSASGIRATIIHHFAGQMDERTQESLSVNAGIKVLFGGLSPEMRKKFAEDFWTDELNVRHHKQERYSNITEYDEEESVSITERDDGGESKTTSSRLIPRQEQVVTGYDDYTREEVLSRLAARLKLPKQNCVVSLPDKTFPFQVPSLRRYLYNSKECLELRHTLPNSHPNVERSNDDTPKRKDRKTLYHAEG